jgi:hypothetical protein
MMDHKTEEALHTLRLIYADLMSRANRSRAKAEEYMISKPEAAVIHRGKAETYTSAASIVKIYCHNIGFDPSTKGEQNVSIRKESEDA